MIAGLLGAVINVSPLVPYHNVTVHAGFVVAMAAAIVLSPGRGMLAAALAALPLLGPAHAWLPVALLVGSAGAIGVLRRRRIIPIIGVIAYWTAATPVLAMAGRFVARGSDLSTTEIAIGTLLEGILGVMGAVTLLSLPIGAAARRWLGRPTSHAPLRVHLFHGFAIISAIPLLILGFVGGRSYSKRLEADGEARLRDQAASLTQAVDAYVREHRQSIDELAIAADREAREPDGTDIGILLAEVGQSHPSFITLLATDSSGKITHAFRRDGQTAKIRSQFVTDRSYFRVPMSTNTAFISGVFRGRGLGSDPIVAISAPIHDRRGRVVGVVEGSLDPQRFAEFEPLAQRMDRGRLYVVDDSSRVVFGSKTTAASAMAPFDSASLGSMLVGSAQSKSMPWRVLLAQPLSAVRAQADQYFVIIMSATLAAIVISFLIATLVAARVTRPIEGIVYAMREFSTTKTPVRLPQVSAQSPREVKALVQDLDALMTTVGTASRELEASLADRDRANTDLSTLLSHLDDLVQSRTQQLATATAKAEDANEAKSRFLATMSHELRTPLHGVISMLRLVGGDNLTDSQREHLAVVRQSADTLLALLNDLLDYSKIEARKLTLEHMDFDPLSVARDVINLMAGKAAQRGVALRLGLGVNVPAAVRGDPTRLRQVLLNLVDNAIKFTERGSVDLHIAGANSGNIAAPSMRFEIEDSGIGMSREQIDRLFQPFTQADETTSRRFGGTGLGLAICRELVSLMGGALSVESIPQQGSTFAFTIQFEAARERVVTPLILEPTHDVATAGTILVVDDNPTNRLVAQATLAQRGFDVLTAGGGEEAIEMLADGGIDMVLMDCRMPDMDGFETTRRIRFRESQGVRLPIVALTAGASDRERKECTEAGMDDFLAKPFAEADLDRVLAKWLAHERTPRDGSSNDGLATNILDALGTTFKRTPGAFAEVLGMFADTIATESERLALPDLRPAESADIAHRIAGAALQIGANGLANDCRRLEHIARDGAAVSRSDIEALRARVPHVLGELSSYCDAQGFQLAAAGRRSAA